MVRYIGRGRCSHARTVHDTKQHFSHSVTGEADAWRPSQAVGPAGVVSVERKGVREVVVLVEDLLHSHEPEVDGTFPERFDKVDRHGANGTMVVDSLCVSAKWAELRDTVSEIDRRKQGGLLIDI